MKKLAALVLLTSLSFFNANAATSSKAAQAQGCGNAAGVSAMSCASVPAGALLPFAGSVAPVGYMLCDGSAVSRSTFAALFAALGTTYGAGDGTTTFNLPDLRGRTAVGRDDMGGTAASRMTTGGSGINGAALGSTGGTEIHTLTVDELATHNHTLTDPGHTHKFYDKKPAGPINNTVEVGGVDGSGNHFYDGDGLIYATTGITIAPAGAGAPHNNTQPSIITNYLIKY